MEGTKGARGDRSLAVNSQGLESHAKVRRFQPNSEEKAVRSPACRPRALPEAAQRSTELSSCTAARRATRALREGHVTNGIHRRDLLLSSQVGSTSQGSQSCARISCDIQGQQTFTHSLSSCLKPLYAEPAVSTNCNHVPAQHKMCLPPVFHLVGLTVPVALPCIIFPKKNNNTLNGQPGRTGRSQTVLVVIASLQCHDDSQQLRACSTPLDHSDYYVMFECLFSGLVWLPSCSREALI